MGILLAIIILILVFWGISSFFRGGARMVDSVGDEVVNVARDVGKGITDTINSSRTREERRARIGALVFLCIFLLLGLLFIVL